MVIMEGRARAAQMAFEDRIAEAWHVAAFSGQAKLKPLKHYLDALKPRTQQSPTEMLAALKAIAGDKMTIRRVDSRVGREGP
jgi:hypothetical protein